MNSSTEYLKTQDLIRDSRGTYEGKGAIDIVFMSKDTLYDLKQVSTQDMPQTIITGAECETLWGAKIITTEVINEKYKFVWASQYELEQLMAGQKIDAVKNLERFIPDFKSYLAAIN